MDSMNRIRLNMNRRLIYKGKYITINNIFSIFAFMLTAKFMLQKCVGILKF